MGRRLVKQEKAKDAVDSGIALWANAGNVFMFCGILWLALAAFTAWIIIRYTGQKLTGAVVVGLIGLVHILLGAIVKLALKKSPKFRKAVSRDYDKFERKYLDAVAKKID